VICICDPQLVSRLKLKNILVRLKAFGFYWILVEVVLLVFHIALAWVSDMNAILLTIS